MKIKTFTVLIIFVLCAVAVDCVAQQDANNSRTPERNRECALSSAVNGQIITVRGEVRHEPHDMAFDIPGCDKTVLLTYPGYSGNDVNASTLRSDKELKRFQKYTSSVYKGRGKNICMGCSKFDDVEAELTGKLEISFVPSGATKDRIGRMYDSSGKFIGMWGLGHPVSFAGYRLIIQSASHVTARKLKRP
jgi:hypothetical protein